MPQALPPAPLLLLDLRHDKHTALPALAGVQPIPPWPDSGCAAATTALLVAIDSESAYAEWTRRFYPLCPGDLPHVVLLAPWDRELARRIVSDGAADCCAPDNLERIELIIARLERRPTPATADPARLLHLQGTVDALPIPIFVKNRERRYTACNRAFAEFVGRPASEIVGRTVYDIAPADMAPIYDQHDIAQIAQGTMHVYETRVTNADGSVRDVIFHKAVFRDAAGEPDGIVGAMLDISERKALEQRLAVLAATDFLTGAYNLRTFHELARHELARLARSGGVLALIVIDLDHFKDINDSLGHAAGDEALRQFVTIVRAQLRDQDIFARAGGDEFRLLLPDTSAAGAYLVAERIRKAVNQIVLNNPRGLARLSISGGIAACEAGDDSLDQATMRADDALYRAKGAGRNCIFPPPEQGWFPAPAG